MNLFPENPGYVLRLTEAEWQEHQANAMFAGLKISYTMDDGVYVVRLTDEQYEEYKKNSGRCIFILFVLVVMENICHSMYIRYLQSL